MLFDTSNRHRVVPADGSSCINEQPSHHNKMHRIRLVDPLAGLFFFTLLLIFPVDQQYIYHRLGNFSQSNVSACSVNKSDPVYIREQEIQAKASIFGLMLNLATFGPCIVSSLVLGTFSDRFGRRFSLISPCIGFVLSNIVSLAVVWYSLPLEVIIIGRIVEGISGGIPILLASSFAYIVDTVPSGTLSLRLALIDMIIGLCGGTGGLVSGYLLEAVGYASVYLCSVGLYLLCTFYVLFVLEDSNPQATLKEGVVNQKCDPLRRVNNPETTEAKKGFYTQVLQTYNAYRDLFSQGPAQGGGHRWYMFFLLLAFMTYAMLLQGVPNLLILVQLNAPLCWDAVLMGYGIAVSCTSFLASFLAVALLRRRLTPPGAALLGLLSFSVGMVLLSFTSTTLMMFLVQIPLLLRVMPAPLMRSMMSNAVLPTEQGTLFSMVSCLQTFSEILATIIFNNVYAATVATFHGFSFILAVAISVIPATIMGILCCCFKVPSKSGNYKQIQDEDPDLPSPVGANSSSGDRTADGTA